MHVGYTMILSIMKQIDDMKIRILIRFGFQLTQNFYFVTPIDHRIQLNILTLSYTSPDVELQKYSLVKIF